MNTFSRLPFKSRYLVLALAATLAGCGGGGGGDSAANSSAASQANGAGQNSDQSPAFSNRQKVDEPAQPAPATPVPSEKPSPVTPPPADLPGDASRIDATRSLMITSLGTVNDSRRTFDPSSPQQGTKGAVWSFGGLMRQLARSSNPSIDESAFARAWISTYLSNQQVVPGETMTPRPGMDAILADWERRSNVGPGGRLDLDMAPFRLLAIVNRIDLRDPTTPGNAGEARFVFGAIDANGNPLEYTIIFEYGVHLTASQQAVQDWARKWVDLAKFNLPQQQEQYNAALQAITDQFTGRTAPAGSASPLDQLRTNEKLGALPWEMREFVFDRASGRLRPATVKKTPQMKFQNTQLLARFINENAAAIMSDGNYDVPMVFGGENFATALGTTPDDATAVGWNAPGVAPDVRRAFSLNTCSGCHHKETNPANTLFFTHVRPRNFNAASVLSIFLTGKDEGGRPTKATDPVTGEAVSFNDLERRAIFLDAMVSNPVSSLVRQKRLTMVH